jgi:hypothetical protein
MGRTPRKKKRNRSLESPIPSSKQQKSEVSLNVLSLDLVRLIFTFLDIFSFIQVQLVCKKFRSFWNDKNLWAEIYQRFNGLLAPKAKKLELEVFKRYLCYMAQIFYVFKELIERPKVYPGIFIRTLLPIKVNDPNVEYAIEKLVPSRFETARDLCRSLFGRLEILIDPDKGYTEDWNQVICTALKDIGFNNPDNMNKVKWDILLSDGDGDSKKITYYEPLTGTEPALLMVHNIYKHLTLSWGMNYLRVDETWDFERCAIDQALFRVKKEKTRLREAMDYMPPEPKIHERSGPTVKNIVFTGYLGYAVPLEDPRWNLIPHLSVLDSGEKMRKTTTRDCGTWIIFDTGLVMVLSVTDPSKIDRVWTYIQTTFDTIFKDGLE